MDRKFEEMLRHRETLAADRMRMGFEKAAAAPSHAPTDGLNGGLDKARDFEDFARARGWSALARISQNDYGTALVTAEKGDTRITLVWREGRFSYASSSVEMIGSKREVLKSRKIRNVSAARKLLSA